MSGRCERKAVGSLRSRLAFPFCLEPCALAAAAALLCAGGQVFAVPLDKEGAVKFGARAYVNARIGTENTHLGTPDRVGGRIITHSTGTFPFSAAGHLRQNRFFFEAELDHKLGPELRQRVPPLAVFDALPFPVSGLAYHVTFRAEYDGVYDWGPKEYATATALRPLLRLPLAALNQTAPDVEGTRRTLRRRASHRERLFQAYIEGSSGPLFLRLGRQVLSWGETDAFQLLDHINPLDASFGGFLIPLDERRVPLDMLRAQWHVGEIGPLTEVFLEGFFAVDRQVGFAPGIPFGSPWALPSQGAPRTEVRSIMIRPSRNVADGRGGIRMVFNSAEATWSLAYLSTYFDTPAVQLFTVRGLPTEAFDDGQPCPLDPRFPFRGNDPARRHCGSPVRAVLSAPRVQVFGATNTFALPRWYSVVRTEVAYFKDEAAYSQYQLDPFLFGETRTTGGRRLRDSINAVAGWDANFWLRPLNAHSTFFLTTQVFFKHILHAAGSRVYLEDGSPNPDREVLPVIDLLLPRLGVPLQPVYVSQPATSVLHTLVLTTSYFSGRVQPFFGFFYDWGGAMVYQPGISLLRDPWRFSIDYSILDAHRLKGGSGISLLKDRDNIQFRVEYVL